MSCTKCSGSLHFAQNNSLTCAFPQNENKLWHGEFYFIQMADPQYGMIEQYLEKLPNPLWDKERKLTKDAQLCISKLINPKPEFIIVCGDLVNGFPGTSLNDPQCSDFIEDFAHFSIPVVVVSGNHDVGQVPTPQTLEGYKKRFGDDYFSFWFKGCFMLVLNSQLYYDASQALEYKQNQESWVDKQLATIRAETPKHSFVFMHIPLFLKTSDEDDQYFNIEKTTRLELLRKFGEVGISVVFCGHYHQNAGGRHENIEVVVTSALGAQLGDDGSGFRVVKVMENDVAHRYYRLDAMPDAIDF